MGKLMRSAQRVAGLLSLLGALIAPALAHADESLNTNGSITFAFHASPSLGCAVIVKRVDAQTRSKTSINELLRD